MFTSCFAPQTYIRETDHSLAKTTITEKEQSTYRNVCSTGDGVYEREKRKRSGDDERRERLKRHIRGCDKKW